MGKNAQHSKKKTAKKTGQQPASTAKKQMKTSTKVIIIIFAVLMAGSMMLPSLVSIFGTQNTSSQDTNAQSSDTSSSSDSSSDSQDGQDESSDASLEGVPENLKSTASSYQPVISSLEAKLDQDPKNLAAILNLAQNYMSWGYTSLRSSSTDEETSYSQGLLKTAISYYDQYLALNDSSAAKVDRALCEYYLGENDAAQSDLEALTQADASYGPAWANLGMLYESAGDTDKATDAYQKAIDADADDAYGAKSFATQRLVSLKASASSSNDTSVGSVSTSQEGLSDALSSKSGVGF